MNNDLESLLNEQDALAETLMDDAFAEPKDGCEVLCGGTAKEMQRAKKNASLYDFLDMVATIVDYALQDIGVEFMTEDDENKLTDPELVLDHPVITYRVISRRPFNEYKPIVREEVIEHDEHNEQRAGIKKGMAFKCIVQFNIFASENKVANKVMETFEELMLSYAGYFMEQGVRQVYFQEQVKDTDYNNFRDSLSVRNIRYYVEIEKLMVIFNRRISNAIAIGDVIENKK